MGETLCRVLQIESQTMSVKKDHKSDNQTQQGIADMFGASILFGEEDDDINVDDIDGRANPAVVACQNGHAVVIESLLKSPELAGLIDVTQKTEDLVDAHDCTL